MPLASGPRRQATQLAERRHDVGGSLVEREAVVLGHVAEPRPHADRVVGDVHAAHLDAPLGGMGEAEEQPERRGLTGSVGADESDPPARHLDAQIVERDHTRIALGHTIETEEGNFHDQASLSEGADVAPPPRVGSGRRPTLTTSGAYANICS